MPVLVREGDPDGNPWGVRFLRMFDMANDSQPLPYRASSSKPTVASFDGNVFVRGSERYLPLYEAKMFHHFDHRFGGRDRQRRQRRSGKDSPST